MTIISSSAISAAVAISLILVVISPPATLVHGLGSGRTIAVSYGTGTVCGIVAGERNRRIECYRGGRVIAVEPNSSYSAVAGGRSSFCALRSGGYSLLCWDDVASSNTGFLPKRLYRNDTFRLQDIAMGDDQICGLVNRTGAVRCWRGSSPNGGLQFDSIASGLGFSCGILRNSTRVQCWGDNQIGEEIQRQFANSTMSSVVAGGSHACGLNTLGFIVCKGSNSSGQLDAPSGSPMEFSDLAIGENHSCAIRQPMGLVVCWGGRGEFSPPNASFISIVAGSNFTCGLTTRNFSLICWGPGWPNSNGSDSSSDLPLSALLPGPCVQSSCSDCGVFPRSEILCSGSENICKPCPPPTPMPPPALAPSPPVIPPPRRSSSKSLSRGLLAFAIVGSVGCVAGICTLVYCLWTGICCGNKKIHNSVQPTITRANSNTTRGSNNSPPSRSSTIRRQGSRIMRRQRSGPSSNKHAERAEEFSFSELVAATNNFSLENKIGSGSFGVVYRGKLSDGREVAIKRGETGAKLKKIQEKESAFESELAFLSRLHHKHLVRLVGYCEEMDERLLVYEYMKNGALYDHLHGRDNVEKNSSLVNSWKTRIRISLDAARGIEYLHIYAVPPIIHRDIKSSNILLDANWTARVSDFGLSLMGPDSIRDCSKPMKAAGTVGYIDPEYYGLNMITAKSDVYGLGVVVLELLTGKRAIFKDGSENGGTPVSIVDFAVPAIMAGELGKVLDERVGKPELNEGEALELVAYTAMHCVSLEGKDRPSMTDIVANLERALAICEDDSHGSISSAGIRVDSE